MIKWIKTERLDLIERLDPTRHRVMMVVPTFSYHHPLTRSLDEFFERVERVQALGFKYAFEINDFIQESELKHLDALMRQLLTYPAQAICFNDLAVGMYLREHPHTIETVYAPETILTNALDIELYLDYFDRVQIAKELTLDELKELAQRFPNRLELFVLGYPMMSMSRRPLIQSYLDEIKSNISSLNQSTFRLYEHKRQEALPILEEERVTSIYSDKCMYPYLEYAELDAMFYGGIHDDLFIDVEVFMDLLNALECGQINPHSSIKTSTAYLYRKTNLTKESTT